MFYKFPFKDLFLKEVKKTRGMVNSHAHLDRAYTLTPEIWELASAQMEEKWILNRQIKEQHTDESLQQRISYALDDFISQGVIACRTHIDADSVVELKAVTAAAKVREKYKDKFTLQLAAHPLEGFFDEERHQMDQTKMELFEKACDICDVIGGLPSRDRNNNGGDKKHAEFLFSVAKNLHKDLDIHLDQENNPQENDTSWFLDMIEKHQVQGRVTLVHLISTSCQPINERKRLYQQIKDLNVNVTVCPKAAISMKQHREKIAPVHNSIAQVDEMLEAGINVSIGVDNISDIFVPENNGDLFEDVLMLASAVRLYDIEKLATIATENGMKTLKL